jgi:hypothetical protein
MELVRANGHTLSGSAGLERIMRLAPHALATPQDRVDDLRIGNEEDNLQAATGTEQEVDREHLLDKRCP